MTRLTTAGSPHLVSRLDDRTIGISIDWQLALRPACRLSCGTRRPTTRGSLRLPHHSTPSLNGALIERVAMFWLPLRQPSLVTDLVRLPCLARSRQHCPTLVPI